MRTPSLPGASCFFSAPNEVAFRWRCHEIPIVQSQQQSICSMIKEFCQEQFVSKGMIADFAIHDKGDGNPHAHILLTLRAMDEHGKWLPKAERCTTLTRTVSVSSSHPATGKATRKTRWTGTTRSTPRSGGMAGPLSNRYLEAAGRPERVDLRSYERQGIDSKSPPSIWALRSARWKSVEWTDQYRQPEPGY